MLKTFLSILLIAASNFLLAQEAYNWQIYSNKSNLSSAVYDGSMIWAGSDGGAFSFSVSDSSFKEFTKATGLNGSPVTAVVIDNYKKVWFGSKNGMIDVYDPSTGIFKRVMAIATSGKPQRGINNLIVTGDTVLACTDFGLSLINTKTLDFYDTWIKFGPIAANSKVYSVHKDGLFFVATQGGLAVQKPGTVNLNDPNAWDVFTTVPGSGSTVFQLVTYDAGNYLVGTNRGLYKFANGNFTSYSSELDNKSVKKLRKQGTKIWILADNSVPGGTRSGFYSFENGSLTASITDLGLMYDIIPSIDGYLYAPGVEGLYRYQFGIGGKFILHNAPAANIFSGITVDKNGNIFSASGRDLTGKGFYKFDGSKWTNFDVFNTPSLPTNSYYNTFTAADGNVYIGSYGKGFIRFKSDGQIIPFTNQNTPLVGISSDPNFLVVSAFKNDSKGNLWILNFDAGDRKTLNMLTPDSTWYGFENSQGIGLTNYSYLEVDQNDTKWFSSPLRNSIYYFNEKNTPSNTADDIIGQLNEASGLNGQKINALAIDKRGDLWVGTDLGVQIVTSLSTVLQNSSTSKPRVSTVFSLRQQKINSIIVDPVNRKWVGTDAGLFLVSSDGTSLLAFYDASNSPLLSNEITMMGSDPKSGKIFVGQTGGLISFMTQAPAPNPDYSALTVYPSPFKPGTGGKLTIDGLIKESDISILDISGNKVTSFSSPGGRVATWDGKDNSGNLVATGVYIIVVSDKEGNTVSKTKTAVVR